MSALSTPFRELLALENTVNREMEEKRNPHNFFLLDRIRSCIRPFTSQIRRNRVAEIIPDPSPSTLRFLDQPVYNINSRLISTSQPLPRFLFPSTSLTRRPLPRTIEPPTTFFIPEESTTIMNRFMQHMMQNISNNANIIGDFGPLLGGPPHPPAEQKIAYLKNLIFKMNERQDHDEKTCGICHDEFKEEEHIINTTCCGTKFMHIHCGIQCLRRSDVCPFCRGANISFSRATNESNAM
jgi:hypothetical protein